MLNIHAIQIARPYAKAAFEYAKGAKVIDAWQKMLAQASAIVENETMQTTLHNPKITAEMACDMIISFCGELLDKEGKQFLTLMAHYRRLLFIPAVAELFNEYKENAEHEIHVELSSPFDIDANRQKTITELLSKKLDRQIKLSCAKDESLLGGVVVRAGDLVIDDSIKGRLASLAGNLGVVLENN